MGVEQRSDAVEADAASARPDDVSDGRGRDAPGEAGDIAARLEEMVASSRSTPSVSGEEQPDEVVACSVSEGRASDDASKHILLGPALASPDRFQSRLGKMLLDGGLITKEELNCALLRQSTTGERLGAALVAMGAVASVDAARVLAQHLRLPFVDLNDGVSDATLAGIISEEVARRYVVLPVARWGDRIVMAMANPNDAEMVDELQLLVNAPIVAAVADPVALHKMIVNIYADAHNSDDLPTPRIVPIATQVAFTCPGCEQRLTLCAAPWVMVETNRAPGRYYVWEHEPRDGTKPVHVCQHA
jgi:hypothetical protein